MPDPSDRRYGSDVAVAGLVELGVKYVASNPGASFRGLHDSLTLDSRVTLIETLNEGSAVSIAHGYAKSTGSVMAVALHNLVGLQVASMAIYNAWVDQVPILLIGGSGPANQIGRRPWIDWIHTAKRQSLAVRPWLKWDDEPGSVAAIPETLGRAYHLATSHPRGPVYVAIDVDVQEALVDSSEAPVPIVRTRSELAPDESSMEELVRMVSTAARPVMIADNTGATRAGFFALQGLAESAQIPIVDLGGRFNLPSRHLCDASLVPKEVLSQADLVVALDVRDLAWASQSVLGLDPATLAARAKVVSIGVNDLIDSRFVDLQRFTGVDLSITAQSHLVLTSLARRLADESFTPSATWLVEVRSAQERQLSIPVQSDAMSIEGVIASSAEIMAGLSVQIAHLGPGSGQKYQWVRRYFNLGEPAAYLGSSGGGGMGYGVGASVGAGLGQIGQDRVVVNFQTDGDALQSMSGLWTAAHHRVPVLTIILNNRGYARETRHQANIATERSRSTNRATVGTSISDPDIRFMEIATGYGVEAFGPCHDVEGLREAVAAALDVVTRESRPALVEAIVR